MSCVKLTCVYVRCVYVMCVYEVCPGTCTHKAQGVLEPMPFSPVLKSALFVCFLNE